jgi:hypothetical protein
MKTYLIFFFIFLFNGISKAQDLISKRKGGVINAKVLKTSGVDIDYKIIIDNETFVFSIPRSEVLSIKYEDGTIQDFEKIEIISSQVVESTKITEPDILYFYSGSSIEVIVDSITDTHLFYRDFNNQSGSLNSIKSNLVMAVKYNKNSKYNIKSPPNSQSKFEPDYYNKRDHNQSMGNKKTICFFLTGCYGNSYPIFNQLLGENIEKRKIDNVSSKNTTQIFSSYGGGWNWNVGGGLLFNDRFGIELNYMNFMGNNVTIKNSNLNKSNSSNWSINEITETNTSAQFQSLNGSLIFKYKWLYSRIGILAANINVKADSSYSRDYENLPPLRDSARNSLTKLSSISPQYGFTGGLGIQIPLGKHFAIFGETNIVILNMKPDKMSYMEVKEQGIVKQNPNDFIFNNNSDINNGDVLRKNYPIYSWGWNGGIRILF